MATLVMATAVTATPAAANHDTLCERLGLEPCHSLVEIEARYVCWAEPAMTAAIDSTDPTGVWWIVRAGGFHGCPNSSEDIVRVAGTLTWRFAGQGGGLPPHTCTGYGNCTNGSEEYEILAGRFAIGTVKVGTTSPERPDGSTIDTGEYVFS